MGYLPFLKPPEKRLAGSVSEETLKAAMKPFLTSREAIVVAQEKTSRVRGVSNVERLLGQSELAPIFRVGTVAVMGSGLSL